MAGLCAAAQARERGAPTSSCSRRATAPAARCCSRAASSGATASWTRFRAECPGGDPVLQRAASSSASTTSSTWLETLGRRVTERGTGNPRTRGGASTPGRSRPPSFAPPGTCASARRCARFPPAHAGRSSPPAASRPTASCVRRSITPEADELLLRAAPGAPATGCASGSPPAARLSAGMDEFYGRAMPAPPARVERRSSSASPSSTPPRDGARTRAARALRPAPGRRSTSCSGSRGSPAARALFRVEPARSPSACASAPSARSMAAAERAGAAVPRGRRRRRRRGAWPAITTTLGGLRVDGRRARGARRLGAAGARRRRHRHRRVRQRPGGRPRARPHRRRNRLGEHQGSRLTPTRTPHFVAPRRPTPPPYALTRPTWTTPSAPPAVHPRRRGGAAARRSADAALAPDAASVLPRWTLPTGAAGSRGVRGRRSSCARRSARDVARRPARCAGGRAAPIRPPGRRCSRAGLHPAAALGDARLVRDRSATARSRTTCAA